MRKLAVYVHGKGGNATESEHYKPLLPEYDVIGFDYKSEIPWDAKQEFTNLFDNYCKNYDYIVLIANSIGAFYSACCRYGKPHYQYDEMGECNRE